MSKTIVSPDVKNVKNECIYSGKSYPEVRIYSVDGKLTSVLPWKIFLHKHGYLSASELIDENLSFDVIGFALLRAFQDGILSLDCTKQTGIENHTPVRMSTSLGGKMKKVWAFSTLSLVNPFCMARMKNGELVCAHCYVRKSFHIGAIVRYIQNFYVLTSGILPEEWIPVIREKQVTNHPIIRLESFGDLYSVFQAKNYLAIARKNPLFAFGLWTKNPAILASAIDETGKPENLSTVFSMSRVNLMDSNWQKWLPYFDHIFIVVNTDDIRDSYLNDSFYYPCQCGPASCFKCRKCYQKTDGMVNGAVERLRE